ncbi:MAG: type VI secretion system protein TssA [Deltaproteobacteria bacterium]|nr:type VI secretion system protein TssA [Deltaproteobacteria bacterium]
MIQAIDVEEVLAPIPGENPAGEDIRYTALYEEIKEARRTEEALPLGDWQREVKTADWEKTITLAVQALSTRSKDLQIAVWLCEGLIRKGGFEGLTLGLQILRGLMERFWEGCFPAVEEGDLEFRAAPIEFMNDKLWVCVREIPLTEEGKTTGYSWLKWKESREVGSEADLRNRYGDVDENKKRVRDERIAEGKITAEEFDAAVALSSKEFYEALALQVNAALQEFNAFDALVDARFGNDAPRLAELKLALKDCDQLVAKLLKEKGGRQPTPAEGAPKEKAGGLLGKFFRKQKEPAPQESSPSPLRDFPISAAQDIREYPMASETRAAGESAPSPIMLNLEQLGDQGTQEKSRWMEAVQTLESSGMKDSLDQLLAASYCAPSIREKNRYRLLMARVCLMAGRPDLARPIVEELYALIEELHLEKWESPLWIAEVLDALYRCLTAGEASEEDSARAKALFERLCTTDVTKALLYGS